MYKRQPVNNSNQWKVTFYSSENGVWYTIRPVLSPNQALASDFLNPVIKYWPEGQPSSGDDTWMITNLSGNTYTIRNSFYKNAVDKYPYLHEINGALKFIFKESTDVYKRQV